jgi:transposase
LARTCQPAGGRLHLRARPTRAGGSITLAFCWSHLGRKFYEIYVGGNQPIATEALARIKKLYDIEAEIRGLPPEVRRALRQEKAKPLVDALKPWLAESLARVPKGSKLGEALGYGLNQWDGLVRYLGDGRIEIDSNTVERSVRPLALTRKNALFAGHDLGAKLGDGRITHRDLQVERGRSPRVDDGRAREARQPVAGLAHR